MNTIKAKLVIKFPLIIIISKLNSLHVSQEMNSYFQGEFNIRSEVTLSFSPGTSSLILFSFCCLLFSPKRIPEKVPFKTQSSKTDSRKAKVLEQFECYCNPRKNVVFERYQFWQIMQKDSETVDQFVTRLKNKVKSCEYTAVDDMVRDKFLFSIRDLSVKERLL